MPDKSAAAAASAMLQARGRGLAAVLLLLVASSRAATAGRAHDGGVLQHAPPLPPPPSNLAAPRPPPPPPPPPSPPFTKPPLLRRPPMGWMSWNHFRCGTNASSPDAISAALVSATAAGLVAGGFAGAGYRVVAIDDCWQAPARGPGGEVVADPARFPGGMRAIGEMLHGAGLLFGLYGDVGPKTCAGFPGNGGHFAADAAAMAAAGADFFKADGCNAQAADLPALYKSLSAALAASGRPIALSCSWPAYLPDARAVRKASKGRHPHPLPPIPYGDLAATCHAWRNWVDVATSPSSISAIARYWAFAARHSPGFLSRALPGPGAWHDPDELLVGEDAIPHGWQAAQFALWCVWGAPLFLSADVRAVGTGGAPGGGFSPAARALALDPELIAVNQRGAGGPVLVGCARGGRGGKKARGCGRVQAWARPLEGGAVAVVAARLEGEGGAAPPGKGPVCVLVSAILAAAARTWPEGGGGGGAAVPPRPRRHAALCWRPVPLGPRPEPRPSFRAWTDAAGFPHRAGADEDLCLDVGAEGGRAAAVVGRPCDEADGVATA